MSVEEYKRGEFVNICIKRYRQSKHIEELQSRPNVGIGYKKNGCNYPKILSENHSSYVCLKMIDNVECYLEAVMPTPRN